MNIIEIILCVSLLGFGSSQNNGWKGIVPLHSTRVDVERLLGPALSQCRCDYKTETENLFVLYSAERCAKGVPKVWNVPRDTVISIIVTPKEEPKLSDLGIDLKKFTKVEDPELRGHFTYTNLEEGVTYSISDDGVVTGIEWFPARKDNCLRCPETTPPSERRNPISQ